MISIATSIRNSLPEYQIIREREANTAVSSLAITLPQAHRGEITKVKVPSSISLFAVLSAAFILIHRLSDQINEWLSSAVS